jgi:hypothetical protein
MGRFDWARCCYEVMEFLGHLGKKERAFLKAHPLPPRKPEDPYGGTIHEDARARLLAHPDARGLAEVFAAISESVPSLGGATLESFGVSAGDKVSPMAEQDLGKAFGQMGKALGNRRTNLYVNWNPEFDDVAVVTAAPPAVVCGQRIAAAEELGEARFRIGRALELSRPEYILAGSLAPADFAQLFSNVLKAFHPRHARWRAGDKGAEEAGKLKKALPYKVSKRLAELFQQSGDTAFNSARWREVVHETGNRAGLLMCGDLAVAARAILSEMVADLPARVSAEVVREHAAKPGPLRDLLCFALSEQYFTLREVLGTGVTKAAAA